MTARTSLGTARSTRVRARGGALTATNLWLYALAWYAHQFVSFFSAICQAEQEYHLKAGSWQLPWTGGRIVV